ncbi:MAG: NTP transferase domain-containing protein [Pseudomonadota bacterium]
MNTAISSGHIPILGLILAGGESKRMGEDKSALCYHHKDQAHYLFDLVSSFCDRAYVSCRSEQKTLPHLRDLPNIVDRYALGPLGGILSAFEFNPKAIWLVVACDLPYISAATLKELFQGHDPDKLATAFINLEKNWPEPLCTLYSPKFYPLLKEYLAEGIKCPRRILTLCQNAIKSLVPQDSQWLKNFNTKEEKNEFLGPPPMV